MTQNILDFYKLQGARTTVKPNIFDNFPSDIKQICQIIQGLLVHPGMLSTYNLQLPKKRIEDRYIKTIQENIDQILKIENKSLIEPRIPKNRIVNICRHFSMFLCSVLREKGIPARCRCGFSTYNGNGNNGWFGDHWICEYWNKKEKRWIKVDSQLDDIHILKRHLDINIINPIDLPKETFFCGGVLWRLYRQGLISGDLCGYSPKENDYGEWYIRGNMLRDFFALNKIEYTYQEKSKLMDKNYQPKTEELFLLDKIADLTINVDENFDQLIDFYKKNQNLIPNYTL